MSEEDISEDSSEEELDSEAGLSSDEDSDAGGDDGYDDNCGDGDNSDGGEGSEAVKRSLSWLEADNTDTSDEEEVRNTLGNVPLEWYDDYHHLGYDVEGQKLPKLTSAASDEVMFYV